MTRPAPIRTLVAAGLAFVVSAAATAADRRVHRRSGSPPLSVSRVVATPDELVVTIDDRGLSREDRIPWDRVAAVDPDDDGRLEVGVASGLELGERIWRGIRRLQRHDARLARAAFAQARALEPEVPGPLASTTLEGLVRAGIELGDTEQVLADALILGDLALAGHRSDRFDGPLFPASVVDAATGLVPEVPPVGDDVDLIALRRRLRDTPVFADTSEVRRDLWVRLIERAGPPDVADRGLDEGTRLLLELSRLDAADPKLREDARRRLLDRLDEMPAWRIAWVRWFTGSSAIEHAEGDADRTLQGVLDLVHVLALEDAAPLAIRRAALERAADALADLGRDDDAAVLRAILTFEHPDRPGTESSP